MGIVVLLNPAEGAQEKVPAPDPVKVVLLPMQIVTFVPAPTDGEAGVVIVIISVDVPQLLVTVSV